VDDVDAVARRIEQLGGAIHKAPQDIPGVGRFAVAADPQGAAFMLLKGFSDQPLPTPPAGTPGHTGWHELHTTDPGAALAFYTELFGWKKTDAVDMGPIGLYQLFATADVTAGGVMKKTPETPAPVWLYYFNVEAIDGALQRVREEAGQVLFGPQQVPGGSWIAQCLDPQGALFALVAPAR
jgi:predicted enzyme related to lactoylglutathione lyase